LEGRSEVNEVVERKGTVKARRNEVWEGGVGKRKETSSDRSEPVGGKK
jgi:hypothetical protein